MDYRALEYRFFYSHDANVDLACEVVRLELPPALLQHEDGACRGEATWHAMLVLLGVGLLDVVDVGIDDDCPEDLTLTTWSIGT